LVCAGITRTMRTMGVNVEAIIASLDVNLPFGVDYSYSIPEPFSLRNNYLNSPTYLPTASEVHPHLTTMYPTLLEIIERDVYTSWMDY
jgi:hypothetical protein